MIYAYRGKDTGFLSEKLVDLDINEIEYFVWKSPAGELGFHNSKEGLDFVERLLKGTRTFLFLRTPKGEFNGEIDLIKSPAEVRSKPGLLRGVSIWGKENELDNLYNAYSSYISLKKKNALLKRYGKKQTQLEPPEVLSWFEGRKYSGNFLASMVKKKCRYIIWDYSSDGLFFLQPGRSQELFALVLQVSDELNTEIKKVSNPLDMPFH